MASVDHRKQIWLILGIAMSTLLFAGCANHPIDVSLLPGSDEATADGAAALKGLAPSAATYIGPRGPWDIMLVQDISASFSSVDMAHVRTADLALLDCLWREGSSTSLFGLVIFSGCAYYPVSLASVYQNHSNAAQYISAMGTCVQPGMPPCGGTNIGAAIKRAAEAFISTPYSPEARGRAIVLMTDGAPSHSPSGCGPGNTDQQLATYAILQANLAWNNGISIFTVHYGQGSSANFTAGLVRGQGIFLSTTNAAELPQLMMQICSSITIPLVPVTPASPD